MDLIRTTDIAAAAFADTLADAYEQGRHAARQPDAINDDAKAATRAGYPADHPAHWAWRNGYVHGRRP